MATQKDRDMILVVEDDQNISEMLCTFLRTKQYRLATTPMGEEVLRLCQEQSPSVVLLDINLPDIDGYEVCRRLRSTLATSHIPIIFLTQKNMREDKISGLSVGADDYLTKPFDMDELNLRISNVLRRARYRAGFDQVSGLPGGWLVEERLKDLLQCKDWAILLVSVEQFDRFVSAYRHLKDKFAGYVAELLQQAVSEAGNFEDFVGRVGTIDFIVVTTPPRVPRLQERIERKFSQAMNPRSESSLPDGGKRPVTADLSLSFGLVLGHEGPFGDVRSLGEAVMRSRNRR